MSSSSGRQPNFAALNRGRHLCSAGRPSRSALAHILVPKVIECMRQTVKTYQEREHSILLSVTHTLYVYQVCYRVKDGSSFSSSLE